VGGKNPVNLTKDSTDDNTQPAFSPDGERVAFRSERDGGGIFLMGATGEDVRRLAEFCYNAAWAPDGQDVCSTGWFWRAEDTGTGHNGQLFRINISTGQSRPIPGKIEDARQPSWSPNGYRIAYWRRRQAARYLDWTLLLRSQNKWRALKNKSPSFGGHTRNRLAAVATVNAETLVSRQDDKVGESFAHAHQTSIGEAHRDVAVLLYEP
jgi:Tol biopolymer transport system component